MSENPSVKRPWLAVALSVLIPGLGHAYLRKWVRMAMWIFLIVSVAWLVTPPEILPQEASFEAINTASQNLPAYTSFMILTLRIFNVVDAYVIAKRENKFNAEEASNRCPECRHELEDEDLTFCPWCATEIQEPEHGDGPNLE